MTVTNTCMFWICIAYAMGVTTGTLVASLMCMAGKQAPRQKKEEIRDNPFAPPHSSSEIVAPSRRS